ncbi:hypothetical protein BEN47_16730 [Hymenobacter lapidarius]|uniref:Uncharacterized protein n=1 Tax=Hymenobacter lapidarius TaxID=1908237 RepID=A0A1G1SZS7_9BACT|nr:hypothetical protein [Hymenobacter lapidarius]OGX84122.1 hypothetical protein BEN47_16730 [Hymenobacter lapidarius]
MSHAPASYAVTALVMPPAPSLSDLRARLLPIAQHAGFADVSVQQDVNRYGSTYTATAHERPGGGAKTLAFLVESPAALLATAEAFLLDFVARTGSL